MRKRPVQRFSRPFPPLCRIRIFPTKSSHEIRLCQPGSVRTQPPCARRRQRAAAPLHPGPALAAPTSPSFLPLRLAPPVHMSLSRADSVTELSPLKFVLGNELSVLDATPPSPDTVLPFNLDKLSSRSPFPPDTEVSYTIQA